MGGCVVSCMSMMNGSKQVENVHITGVRSMGPQSVEIGTHSGLPESRIRRAPQVADKTLEQLYEQFYNASLPAVIKDVVTKYSTRKAMGVRPITKIAKEMTEINGKQKEWEFVFYGETKYFTYGEMWNMMVSFGHGMASLGFAPGTRIGIYEETRYEWLVSCYGLWTQKMIGVTVYSNLGEDALIYAIREAELPALIMNGKAVKNIIAMCAKYSLPTPKMIITDEVPAGVDIGSAEVFKFADIVARGNGMVEPPMDHDPRSLALIMYTSGTTGDPKGVMISHGNAVAAVRTLFQRLDSMLGAEPDETYVGYLPLAHILEFAAENVMLMRGAMIGYGSPRTLTDTSAKPRGDLKEFKPLMLAGVPRIYDTIKKAVESKLPPEGELKRRVFDRAYQERKEALAKGLDTPYWNEKVFANPRELVGGRVRAMISGGAPLSAPTMEFMSIVFGCSIGQGYGLTETCACATIQRYYDLQPLNAGGLVDAVEMKLKDVEDWKHTDPEPRGEVLLRGPVITQGYYKQPEKTAEAFLADGWFATGDVGMVAPDGTLKIVGRTKAMAKNAHGEYIALEALEVVYVLNELCMPNGVCVIVDSHQPFICAIALTDESKTMAFAAKNGIEGTWPAILDSPAFRKKAVASMAETAKKNDKKPFETVKAVRFLNEEWTPENGVLTAAMKLKRRVVDVKYAELIATMFKEASE